VSGPVIPVVVVGAGPTGVTAATLLARDGIGCLVLDRWAGVYPQPRAVHLDDEVYRVLARLGIGEEFAAISRPCRGLRLLDPHLRVLAEFSRDAGCDSSRDSSRDAGSDSSSDAGLDDRGRHPVGIHGFPRANMFDQPELEQLLRTNLARQPAATLRGNVEVTGLTQHDDHVRVRFVDRLTGEPGEVTARYVLGCDGANSVVRSAVGAGMDDLGFEQRWLVVDIAAEGELGQWEGVHQVCDPVRAATYMRIGTARHRWEFRLLPGETAGDYAGIGALAPLIEPWTGGLAVSRLRLLRVAEYTFRAQLADRWRDRRVFVLGDAAHLTPPFIGQGMGAGVRDAANLSWKLAGVLRGELPEQVLDSYQTERRPHARAMIRLAKAVGAAMTAGGAAGNLIRRVVAPRLARIPGLRAHLLDSETPALRRSALVARPRLGRSLAGRLCPNAVLGDGRRFDDVAGGRFALVTAIRPPEALRAELAGRGAAVVDAAPGSPLHRWLRRGRARVAVVRPDGVVARTARDLPRCLRPGTSDPDTVPGQASATWAASCSSWPLGRPVRSSRASAVPATHMIDTTWKPLA